MAQPARIPREVEKADVSLNDILITSQLESRPRRPIEQARIDVVLTDLGDKLRHGYHPLINALTYAALTVCDAGTGGLSVLRGSGAEQKFHWDALAGAYSAHVGGTTPRNFSPCGVSLDLRAPQLFDRPARYYTYLQGVLPEIIEALVIPMQVESENFGALWVLSHDPKVRFDESDVRVMRSLASFARAGIETFRRQSSTPAAVSQKRPSAEMKSIPAA